MYAKLLTLTYKFVWIEYLDRESIYISTIFGVLSILLSYFIHLFLTICIYFQVFGQCQNILYILNIFIYPKF